MNLIDEETGLGFPHSDDKNSLKYNDNIICEILLAMSENKTNNLKLENYMVNNITYKEDVSQIGGELALYLYNEKNTLKYMISPLMDQIRNIKFQEDSNIYFLMRKSIKWIL